MTASTESGVHPACLSQPARAGLLTVPAEASHLIADVAELADASDLGSGDLTVVGVQISPSALSVDFAGDVSQMITLATWARAPAWLTPDQAAALMGPAYTPEAINTLIAIGAVGAEQDGTGAWLVEKNGALKCGSVQPS